eukprot:s1872_g9.t1
MLGLLPWIQILALAMLPLPGSAMSDNCFDSYWGHMPNFKQCDPRWKCFPYAGAMGLSTCNTTACREGGPPNQSNNICGSGCGITSSAMLLTFFNRSMSPPDVASYFLAQGYRNDLANISGATCNGVTHEAICNAADHWGLSCSQSSSFDDLDTWLPDGPVIAHVRHHSAPTEFSCKFTRAGHYIVITEKDAASGQYRISDPNSCDEAQAHGSRTELSSECDLVGFIRIFPRSLAGSLLV